MKETSKKEATEKNHKSQESATFVRRRIINSAKGLHRELGGRKEGPDQYTLFCPAHDDGSKHNRASLSVKQVGDKILLHCFAGCEFKEIIGAIKRIAKKKGFVYAPRGGHARGKKLPSGVSSKWRNKYYAIHHSYKNQDGETLGYVVRYRDADGNKEDIPYFQKEGGEWKAGYPKGIKDPRPLFNLDGISESRPDEQIWVAEGEKAAAALISLGVVATTSPGGASAPHKADWSPLAGRRVIIWPDTDKAGKIYAVGVWRQLTALEGSDHDISLVNVEPLGLPEKGDAFDWVEQGHDERDLLSLSVVPISGIDELGVVEVRPDAISDAVDQSEELLLKKRPYDIFQRCGRLVRILETPLPTSKIIGLQDVTIDYLRDLLNRNLTFVHSDSKSELIGIDPPQQVAARYLARSGHWKAKLLHGLIYTPTLRPDGSILERAGYDEATHIFYASNLRIAPLNPHPAIDEAKVALKKLREPLQDFPFVSKREDGDRVGKDESVILAAILTTLIRQSLPTSPLFAISAPVAGSGKTLLAKIVAVIATGQGAAVIPQGKDREEERKHLFARLLQGKPVIVIDNIENPLQSDILCAILTTQLYSDRILGKTETVEVPTNVTFLATGNNLTFIGDITRRVLLCSIDPIMERPDSRADFEINNLEQWVLEHRDRLVKAGLIILKAYHEAGRPKLPIEPLGSFEEWSDWVRSALVWLGCEDPVKTRLKIERGDPQKENLSRIISLWKDVYGEDRSVTVLEILKDCTMESTSDPSNSLIELAQAFREVARGKGKDVSSNSLGYWLRKNRDKVQDGYRIIKDEEASPGNRNAWRLEKVN